MKLCELFIGKEVEINGEIFSSTEIDRFNEKYLHARGKVPYGQKRTLK